MIRVAAIVIYLAIGMGVVAVESKKSPSLTEDKEVAILSVALWPAFPVARIYKQLTDGTK